MAGQNSSPYGRGYYGDDDPRYSEPSGTPISDDVHGPNPPPTLTPPPTTTVPAANTPTSIQQNNKTFHELLFSLYQYNKNLLKTQMEKTKEEISTLTDEIKKNQKMTSFGQLLTKLNKLQEEFGDKIEDITEVGGLDHFIDNLEEVNKEMDFLATNTKLLGIGMKKTSYQQELSAAIQRKQEKESSSRLARFFDGMSAGLLNLRKLVNIDEVVEEQKKNVSNAIDSAVSNLSAGVGTRSTGPGGVRYRNVQEFLDAQGITAGTDIPLPPRGEPGGTVDHVGHDRANLLRAAQAGVLDADQRRELGIAQAPQGANPKSSEYSSDQKDLARRFIMRAPFEEGKMIETIQKFLENSEMVHEVIMKTASSSLESYSDEMKDIFTSFAAGEYEIGMDKEVFGKKLEFLVEKFKGEEYEQIQEALKESQLTGEERKEFIRDTLGYSRHIVVDEQKTKEMVTKELDATEAEAEAEEYNKKIREATSEDEKKKIIEEAKARGYKIQRDVADQKIVSSKEYDTLKEDAIRLNEMRQNILSLPEGSIQRDQEEATLRELMGDKFEILNNEVVPKLNDELNELNDQASRLTEELRGLEGEAKEDKIRQIEREEKFNVKDSPSVTSETVVADIKTKPLIAERLLQYGYMTKRFMEVKEEQETSKITARDADDTERKRIERERPEKARVEYGGEKGQIQRDPAVLKAKELQEEKDAILSDLEGDIKNKSERKVFREKMQPLVVDRSVTALQFQEKARSARFAAETGLIFSTGMRQAGQRGLGIRENIKQGVIYQAASEAKYQAKASKTDFIRDKVSSMTTSALTGGMMNKLLLLVPGIGPALSIGWTVISKTFSALLSVGKFIFGMVGKVFKVLGEVLGKLLELGTKFLKSFVKYGTIALVAWTLLFHFGLKDRIMPMVTGLIKKVAPIIFEFLTTILRYVNEALEGLVVDLNKMLEGGIYDIPRKIFEFFFGKNGVFGEETGFGALTSELGRLGNNLVEVGGVLLDALKALGVAMYDYFVDIVWPLYLKPAFSSLRDSISSWLEDTKMGQFLKTYVLDPLRDAFNKVVSMASLLYDSVLDILNSAPFRAFLTDDTEKALNEALGRRVASRLGVDTSKMSEEEIAELGREIDQVDTRYIIENASLLASEADEEADFLGIDQIKEAMNGEDLDVSTLDGLRASMEKIGERVDRITEDFDSPNERFWNIFTRDFWAGRKRNELVERDKLKRSQAKIAGIVDYVDSLPIPSEEKNALVARLMSGSQRQRTATEVIGDALTQPAVPGGGSLGDYQQLALEGGAHTQGVMNRHLSNLRETYANATPEQKERIRAAIASSPRSVFQVSGNNIGFSPQYTSFQGGNFSTGNRPIPEELENLGYAVNNEGYISNKIGIDIRNQNRNIRDYIEAPGINEDEKKRRIDLLDRVGLHKYDEKEGVQAAPAREVGDMGTNINELMGKDSVLSPNDVEKQTGWVSASLAEQEHIISQVGRESRSLESAIRENTAATQKNTEELKPKDAIGQEAIQLFGNFAEAVGVDLGLGGTGNSTSATRTGVRRIDNQDIREGLGEGFGMAAPSPQLPDIGRSDDPATPRTIASLNDPSAFRTIINNYYNITSNQQQNNNAFGGGGGGGSDPAESYSMPTFPVIA